MNNISTSQIAFHTPTEDDYNKILELIDKKDDKAKWGNSGKRISNDDNQFDELGSYGKQTCIGYNPSAGDLAVSSKFVYEKCGVKILSMEEAIQYIRNIKI